MEVKYDHIHLRHGHEGDVKISSIKEKKQFSTNNVGGDTPSMLKMEMKTYSVLHHFEYIV